MINTKQVSREAGNKHTRTMRIHKRVYEELDKLKTCYAELHKLDRVSFSEFLTECAKVGEMLLTGEELYEANGKLFSNIESARGEAVLASVKSKAQAVPPTILVRIGQDPLLKKEL